MVTSATIGLFAWLFTETLTREGHIFAFVGRWVDTRPLSGDNFSLTLKWYERIPYKYATCSICLSGALALVYAFWTGEVAEDIPHLFTYPVIAMAVAKVMALKF